MRIKKTSQYIEGGASLSNEYGTSNENGYTQEYINELETYSTDETVCGTWIDGKPLYRKVFTGIFDGSGGGSSTTTHVHQILPSTCNIKNSCSDQNKRPLSFYFVYNNNSYYISYMFAKNSSYNYSWTMSFWYSEEYAGQTYEIAVEYTKDTD